MSRSTVIILTAAVFLASLTLYVYLHPRVPVSELKSPAANATTQEAQDLSALSLYSSGTYGFSVAYPSVSEITDAETVATATTTEAALEKGAELYINMGTTSLTVLSDASKSSVASCANIRHGETALPNETINGTPWSIFTHSELGTDDPSTVISYRTVHANACVTLRARQPYHTTYELYPAIDTSIHSFSFASV
jgi:hypothetical protein